MFDRASPTPALSRAGPDVNTLLCVYNDHTSDKSLCVCGDGDGRERKCLGVCAE